MNQKKTKTPTGDMTRTERSARHRERLAAAQGKRVVVDMPVTVVEAMDGLLAQEYGSSQKDVVCKAILEVAAKLRKRA